jgi:hypothetical protein
MSLSNASRTTHERNSHHEPGLVALLPLIGIAVIILAGAVLGHLIGPSKVFVLVSASMVLWSLVGWLVGGLGTVMAGAGALTAGLAAAYGNYPLVIACAAFALVFVWAQTFFVNAGDRS